MTTQALRNLASIDARLYVALGQFEERLGLYKVARTLSFTGDGYAYLLIAVGVLLFSADVGLAVTLTGLLAFGIELPLYVVMKKSFKRRRPYKVVLDLRPIHVPSDEFSFPSGHTSAGFLMAYVVSHFFPIVTIPMYIWASLIGLSRVMLRVHFVSDILAGALFGTLVAAASVWLLGY